MLIVLILASLMAMTVAMSPEKEIPVFLCGRQLANARVILCYGSEYVNKKSLDTTFATLRDEKWHEEWPWVGRRGALSASWTRYKRDEGLADLCCLKPCTTDVILNYC